MALFKTSLGGRRKRLSFDSPVRERAQAKRLQYDLSSSEEEEQMERQSIMESLCQEMKNFSPCRTQFETEVAAMAEAEAKSDKAPSCSQPPPLLRKPRPVSRFRKLQKSSSLPVFSTSSQNFESPAPSQKRLSLSFTPQEKLANVNPFTTAAILEGSRKKRDRQQSTASRSSASSDSSFDMDSDNEELLDSPPSKRLRASDLQVCRYHEEFLQLGEIATGEFGTVIKARHRLDGILYAIKITKDTVQGATEREAMKEVFAHAVLKKHKNVVSYYSSWAEDGRVFIQNEYCNGGTLGMQIRQKKALGEKFSEAELAKVLVDVMSGLKYMHSKQLAHLDIKPDNIFISREREAPVLPAGEKTSDFDEDESLEEEEEEEVCYKIGDLGHVVQVEEGDFSPEEGDCRYMAPEFLSLEPPAWTTLPKADVFSLGMSIFEAASLIDLPRNSDENRSFHEFQQGRLPYLHNYTKKFNQLLRSMVEPTPSKRPSCRTLLSSPVLTAMGSKKDLLRELEKVKESQLMLEQRLAQINSPSWERLR